MPTVQFGQVYRIDQDLVPQALSKQQSRLANEKMAYPHLYALTGDPAIRLGWQGMIAGATWCAGTMENGDVWLVTTKTDVEKLDAFFQAHGETLMAEAERILNQPSSSSSTDIANAGHLKNNLAGRRFIEHLQAQQDKSVQEVKQRPEFRTYIQRLLSAKARVFLAQKGYYVPVIGQDDSASPPNG